MSNIYHQFLTNVLLETSLFCQFSTRNVGDTVLCIKERGCQIFGNNNTYPFVKAAPSALHHSTTDQMFLQFSKLWYVFRVRAHKFYTYSHFSFSYSIVLSKVPIKTSLEKYLPTYVFVGLFVCRQKGKSKCLIMLQLLLFKTNFHQIRFDKKWRGIAPRWNQRLCCNCLLLKKCLIGFLYTFQKMDKKVSVICEDTKPYIQKNQFAISWSQ